VTHIWLPSALIRDTLFQRTHANKFSRWGGSAKFTKDKQNALGINPRTFPATGNPALDADSHVSLKNYAVDSRRPAKRRTCQKKTGLFLQPSRYVPTEAL